MVGTNLKKGTSFVFLWSVPYISEVPIVKAMGVYDEHNLRRTVSLQELLRSSRVSGGLIVVIVAITGTWLWGTVQWAFDKHNLWDVG